MLQTRFECTVMHFSEMAVKCLPSDCSNSQAYRAGKKFRHLPGQFMGPTENICELIDIREMCRDWSRASQKTYRTSVTKFSRLMLFREAVAVYHVSRSHITTDSQSASSSWCLAPFGASDQMLHLFE
jgi:hypothetical protein